MGNLIEYRCGLIDFQVGRDHGKLDFDPAEYIRSCVRSNMKRVMFTCKDAYGDAYYKSELVNQNPMAGNNYLQTAIDEAKKLNIELFAYYNIFLDDIYADMHPEHRITDNNGKHVIAYDYYKSLCPNSPYSDVIRERVADLVFNYDIDGIFFDITYFQSSNCYCDYCKEKFLQNFGYELKNDIQPGTGEYSDFNEFKRMSRAEILIGLTETVRRAKDIPVIWNGSGSFYLAEPETDSYSDYLTTEFHAPDYLDGIVRAKWMQSRGSGFIMSTPSELASWGDWTMIPHSTLKSTVCSIAAHGGGVFFNHTPYPSGEFAQSHTKCIEENIRESFLYLEKFENYLRDTESAADTAVVFSVKSKRFCENGFAGYSLTDYTSSLKGAVRMMLESGIPFDIVDEETFNNCCNKYKTIVIPGSPCLDAEFIEKVQIFTGGVIACGETGVFSEYGKEIDHDDIQEIFGFIRKDCSEYSVEYISDIDNALIKGVPELPILVKHAGRLQDITADTAEIIACKTVPPFEATLDRHVYHQHAHPFKRTEYAAITRNRNKVFFSADIFRSYNKTASPWLKKLFLNSLNLLNKNPILRINAPECVYPTLLRSGGNHVLQVININGPIHEVSKGFPEEMMEIPYIEVSAELQAKNIYYATDNKKINFKMTDEKIEFTIENVGIHKVIIIETGDKE